MTSSYTLAFVAAAAALSIAYALNCTEEGSFCEPFGDSGDVQFIIRSGFASNETADLIATATIKAPPAATTTANTADASIAAAGSVLAAAGSVLAAAAAAVGTVAKLAAYSLTAVALLVTAVLAVYGAVFVLPQATTSSKTRAAVGSGLADLAGFYGSLYHYLVKAGRYPAPGRFEDRAQARAQIFSLAMAARLWAEPHYRSGTFQNDMRKNLRNVAVPGTGVPLSVFCVLKPVAYAFVLVAYPLAALASAVNMHRGDTERVAAAFSEQLVTPQDWFSFWRLNCLLSTFHAHVTGDKGYDMEDKHAFLTTAEREGIPVSPSLKMPKLIVKHRNEEGGLGLHAFTNAFVDNGDWLIQEHLENDDFVAGMLPEDAPLSTFRVVSQSRAGLPSKYRVTADGADEKQQVTALSCVFRAGREGAVTDHVSVLYDVDMTTGVIGLGTTNQHWYQLGPDKVATTPWNNTETTTVHPDTGRQVTGTRVGKRLGEMLELVETAHAKMCPNVPLVGWDVAFTRNNGMLLLEANYSCNFFRGSFDKNLYASFVDDYFMYLDEAKYGDSS